MIQKKKKLKTQYFNYWLQVIFGTAIDYLTIQNNT